MGEYCPLRSPCSSPSAKSLMRENNCGSKGLILPKTLGAGVSVYGPERPPSTSDWLKYISGQYELFAAEAPCAVVTTGRMRLALARAVSRAAAPAPNWQPVYLRHTSGSQSGL